MKSSLLRNLTKLALVNGLALVFGLWTLAGTSAAASPAQAVQPPALLKQLAASPLGAPQPIGSREAGVPLASGPNAPLTPERHLPDPAQSKMNNTLQDVVVSGRDQSALPADVPGLISSTLSQGPISGTLSQDWGDFDRDGYLDLALGTTQGISIYHNNLNGQLIFSTSLSSGPVYGLRWADLNGDGQLELAAVGDTSGIRIYSRNGSDFAQSVVVTADIQLVRVVPVRGISGTQDLIASTNALNASCSVLRFINNGQGQFSPNPQCVSTSPTAGISVGDFNKDGWPDLVLGRFPNGVMLITSTNTSTMTNGVLTETNGIVFDTTSSWPYDFAWGDYDGDGRLDLAVAFPLQRQVRLYHNEGAKAAPPFKLSRVIATQRFMTPLALDWGDFNGDGELDLAVADDPPLVYFSVGRSIGASSSVLRMRDDPTAEKTWSARAVALNNSDLSLLLSGQLDPSLLYQTLAGHLQSQLTPITNAIAASSLAWGDADGNGQMDLLLGGNTAAATLYPNVNGIISTTALRTFGSGQGQLVAFGKFDRKSNGQLGVVIGDNSGRITVYTQTNGSPAAWSWSINSSVSALALGDSNNDGYLDLLVGTGTQDNGSILVYDNYLGTLGGPTPAPILSLHTENKNPVRSIAWADYRCTGNNGGNNDYLSFAVATASHVYVYCNNHDNTFTPIQVATGISITSVAWGDFDGDGSPDLAVGTDGQGIKIYRGGTELIWTSTYLSHTTSLASGDWNNDGQIDLAVGNDGEPNVVFANQGNTSGSLQLSPVWSSSDSGSTTAVAWGDVNNDGYLDLAVSRRNGPSGVYYNTSVVPWRLPNPPSYLSILRPGKTWGAYLYSSSDFIPGYLSDVLTPTLAPTVTIYYTAFNSIGTPITNTWFEYSLDGGTSWHPASPTSTTPSAITQTAPLGRPGKFIWDAFNDGASSDNALFRIQAVDQSSAGPWQRASSVAVSPPFRARAMSCQWPTGLLIEYTPQTGIVPYAPVAFEAKLSDFSGTRITYTWKFGDGNTATGSIVHHAYTDKNVYTVTLNAESTDCPSPEELTARTTVQVQPQLKVYLPLVQRSSTALNLAKAKPDKTAPSDLQKPATPFAVTGPSVCLPIPSPFSKPTVAWITATQGYFGQPVLNGDGSRFAFWSSADLVTSNNSDGNIELFYGQLNQATGCVTVTQVTNSTGGILEGFNLGPSINTAGDEVAFFSDRDLVPGSNPENNFEIFLASISNTGRISITQLTTTSTGVNVFPSISSDGSQIAFASTENLAETNSDKNQEIYVATIDSSGQVSYTQVTHTGPGIFNDEPSISENGQSIAFVRGGNAAGGNSGGIQEVYVADVSAGREITLSASPAEVINYHPTLGGNGSRVAYAASTITQEVIQLATVISADVSVAAVYTLPHGNSPMLNAGDGSRIVVISDSRKIKVLNPGGSGVIPVFTCPNGDCSDSALSGDGMHVAFVTNTNLSIAYYEKTDLSLALAAPIAQVTAGDRVTYTLLLANQGPSSADGLVVSGTLQAGAGAVLPITPSVANGVCASTPSIACFASLPVSATVPITIVADIPSDRTAPVTLTASVTAWQTGTNLSKNSLSQLTDVGTESDLAIANVATGTMVAGDRLTYTLFITNQGPSDAQNVVLSADLLPADADFVTQTQTNGPTFTLTNAGLQVTDTISRLRANQSASFAIVVKVRPEVPRNTLINNTANIAADTPDLLPGNNTASASVSISTRSDLTVTKSVDADVVAGLPITYTLVVSNPGPSVARNILLTDSLPSGVTEPKILSGCADNGVTSGQLTCTLPYLGRTVSQTIVMTADVASYLPIRTPLTNIVAVSADDAAVVSNSVTSLVNVNSNLQITKRATGSVAAGEPLTYTLVVTNLGSSYATGVTVKDRLATGSISYTGSTGPYYSICSYAGGEVTCQYQDQYSLPPGQPVNYTIYATTYPTLEVGTLITNTASVTATSTMGTWQDTATTTVNSSISNLTVTKSAASTVIAGKPLAYTITITNSGPSWTPALTVTDILTPGLTFSPTLSNPSCGAYSGGVVTCTLTNLLPGLGHSQSITITGIVSAGLSSGTLLTNTASVTGSNAVAAGASPVVTTAVTTSAQLTMTKSGPISAIAGQYLTYTIVVTNLGPSLLRDEWISDTLQHDDVLTSTISASPGCGIGYFSVSLKYRTRVTCSLASTLWSGQAIAITITGQVNSGASGSISNTAVATSTISTAVTRTISTPLAKTELALSKSSDDHVIPGNLLTYTLVVTNLGPAPALTVTLADRLPLSVTYNSTISGGQPISTGQLLTWTLPVSLPVNGTNTVVFNAWVLSATVGTLTNTAYVSSTTAMSVVSATATTTVTLQSNLTLSKRTIWINALARIDAGSTADYTDHYGNIWIADTGFTDGYPRGMEDRGINIPISNTLDDRIYQTEHWGMTAFAYTVPNGAYQVNLHFAETFFTTTADLPCPGKRIFSVTMEGTPISDLTNLDVCREAGGPNTALIKTEYVNVTNNSLDMTFTPTPDKDNPEINGIEIIPVVPITAGTSITYLIGVGNLGPSTAPTVTITDALPSELDPTTVLASPGCDHPDRTITCTLTALALGQNASITITAGIYPSVTAPFTNTAYATSTIATAVASSSVSTTVATSAQLTVTKSASNTVFAGNPLTYTIIVTNNGPSSTPALTVIDPLPPGLTFSDILSNPSCGAYGGGVVTCSGLEPYHSQLITLTGIVSAGLSSGTRLTNTASITGTNATTTVTSQIVTTVTSVSHLTVTQSAADMVIAGNPLTYTIIITNNGPSWTPALTVTDKLTSGLTFSPTLSTSGYITDSRGVVTYTPGALLPNQSWSITLTGIVSAGLSSSTRLTNTASVTGSNAVAAVTSPVMTTTVTTSAQLTVTKSAAMTVTAGLTTTYTMVVTNTGPSAARNVLLTDSLPSGVTGPKILSGCTDNGVTSGQLTCTLPYLGRTVSQTIVMTADVASYLPMGTPLINSVWVSADDAAVVSNSVTSLVATSADLSISANITPTNVFSNTGGVVTVTVTFTNGGPSNATNVFITETLGVLTSTIYIVTQPSYVTGPNCNSSGNRLCTWMISSALNPVSDKFVFTTSVPATTTPYTQSITSYITSTETYDSKPGNNTNSNNLQITGLLPNRYWVGLPPDVWPIWLTRAGPGRWWLASP